jgi:hypothetical protein
MNWKGSSGSKRDMVAANDNEATLEDDASVILM